MSPLHPDYDSLNEDIAPHELAEILGAENVTRSGDTVNCSCPSFKHKDENPSASIFRSKDGTTLLKCHAECQFVGNSVMAYKWVYDLPYSEAAENLTTQLADLRAGGSATTSYTPAPFVIGQPYQPAIAPSLTLKEYAKAKKLPLSILREFDVEEESHKGGTALAFPCFTPDGDFVLDRYRLWMKAPDGEKCFDHPFNQPVYPFGLNRLKAGRARGETRLMLAEGESDTITLAHHDVQAVGIPGASAFKPEWPDFFPDFEILVWQEHGKSGDTFVKKIAKHLPDALVVRDLKYDDVSDMHIDLGGDKSAFRERLSALTDAARPISEVVQEIETQQVAVNSGPWGEPILPDSAPDLDPYPTFDLPHSLYRFVEEVAEGVQVSSDMVLMATLSTVSACVAGKAEVTYNGWTQPLQLWTGTVADSSTGKSPAFRLVSAPIGEWEVEEKERTKTERADRRSRKAVLEKTLEKLTQKASGPNVHRGSQDWLDMIKEMTDIRKELEDYPPVSEPRLTANDSTPEALVRVMEDNNERVFVESSEADVLKILGGMYSDQANTALWKAGYDSDPYRYDRVRDSESVYLSRPALAATIMMQPVVLQTLRNKRVMLGEGLIGRFLFAVPKSTRGYRRTGPDVSPPDPAVLGEYDRRIKTLLDLPFPDKKKALPLLGFTQDATQLLYDLEAEFEKEAREDGVLEAVPDWGGKLFGKTLRLAGVLHLFDAAQHGSLSLVGGGTIGEDMVQAAGDLARAAIPHTLASYGMLSKDERMEVFEYVFKRYKTLLKSGDRVTKRDLFQAVKNKPALRKRVSSLDTYIGDLEEREVLRQVKTTGIGRPSVVLVPNPDLVSDVTKKGLTGTGSVSAKGASKSFDPFDPVNGGREENIKDGHDGSSDPFDPANREENEAEEDTAGEPHGSFDPFDTLNSREKKGKIESTGDLSEETGSSEPHQGKIQPPEGDKCMSDTLDSQDQKDQNSDDPYRLPPTTELF